MGRADTDPPAPWARRVTPWLLWGLVVVGVALRLDRFLQDRALWRDEAMLALDLRDRPADAFLGPLPYHQSAPPLYAVAVKGLTGVLGDGERAWRLLPLLGGLGSLFLFHAAVRRALGALGGLVALTVFATSDPLVRYAAEAKPYGVDVAVATLMLWLVVRLTDAAPEPRLWARPWLLAPLGAACVAISFPGACVVGAAALVLVLRRRTAGRPGTRAAGIALGAAAVASAAALHLRRVGVDPYLVWHWRAHRPPLPWPPGRLGWYVHATVGFFDDPVGMSAAPGAGALVAFAGLLRSVHARGRVVLAFAAATVALTLVASAAAGYPFLGRFLLFLMPAVAWLLGAACDLPRGGDPTAAWVIAAVPFVVGPVLVDAARATFAPVPPEDARPLLSSLRGALSRGDVLYLHPFVEPVARWYAPDLWDARSGVRVVAPPDGDVRYLGEDLLRREHAPSLRGHARVWLVDSDQGNSLDWFLSELGRVEASVRPLSSPGYRAVLYDTR